MIITGRLSLWGNSEKDKWAAGFPASSPLMLQPSCSSTGDSALLLVLYIGNQYKGLRVLRYQEQHKKKQKGIHGSYIINRKRAFTLEGIFQRCFLINCSLYESHSIVFFLPTHSKMTLESNQTIDIQNYLKKYLHLPTFLDFWLTRQLKSKAPSLHNHTDCH